MGHHNAKKLIYSETLHKTESPKKKFWQHTLGENLKGWGGGGGGVFVSHTSPHYPTPDTQT